MDKEGMEWKNRYAAEREKYQDLKGLMLFTLLIAIAGTFVVTSAIWLIIIIVF